jgi:hypothetical protein
MSWVRYLLWPALVCPSLLVAGALKHPAGAPARGAGPLTLAATADPVASEILDQAIAMLNPNRALWLEANIWQRVTCADMTYQAEGRLQTGPGQRMHVDLDVVVSQTRAHLQMVSDGKAFWQAEQVEGKPRRINRMPLEACLPEQDRLVGEVRSQPERRSQLGFSGLVPLLEDLRRRLLVTGKQNVAWKTGEAILLTLVWPPETAASMAPLGQIWPELLPRKCLLYLDAVTLWPHRLEWWAPARASGPDCLIVEIEFRDPILNRQLAADEIQRAFTFRPGKDRVIDQAPDAEEPAFPEPQAGRAP